MSGARGDAVADVTVRYWAAMRSAAGTPSDQVASGRLDQVLAEAARAHAEGPRFAQVLAICSVLVDEEPVGGRDPAEVMVVSGSVVDLLPPFAGG
jgi:molybdopterin converting factor small subunit